MQIQSGVIRNVWHACERHHLENNFPLGQRASFPLKVRNVEGSDDLENIILSFRIHVPVPTLCNTYYTHTYNYNVLTA